MNDPSFPGGPPTSRRLSTWKIVGIVAAVVVAVLLISLFWVYSITERRWARLQEEMRTRAGKERARDPRRPLLRGSGEPGNAWDDYKLAIAEAQKISERNKLSDLAQRLPNADLAWGATAIEQYSIVLEHVRRGAARSTFRCDSEWEKGMSLTPFGLGEVLKVSYLALLKARALVESGRQKEAAGVLLDALQFGRDVADNGPLISGLVGSAMMSVAMDGVVELATAEKADADALAELDQGLSVLDGSYPSYGACVLRENLCAGMTFAHEGPGLPGAGGAGWSFPQKFLYLQVYDTMRENAERTAQDSDRSWAECHASAQRMEIEVRKSWNPILRMMTPGQETSDRVFRQRQAQVRLLRVATHYRRTGELLDLDDPFGGKLRTMKVGEELKIWSVGSDGVDSGGTGTWKPQSGPDIVVRTRR